MQPRGLPPPSRMLARERALEVDERKVYVGSENESFTIRREVRASLVEGVVHDGPGWLGLGQSVANTPIKRRDGVKRPTRRFQRTSDPDEKKNVKLAGEGRRDRPGTPSWSQ
jgi:hypothetical protein